MVHIVLHRQRCVWGRLTGHLEIPANSNGGEKEMSAQLCGGHCAGTPSLSGLHKPLSHFKKMMHAFRNMGL